MLRKAPGWEGLTTREEEDLRRSRNPRILLEEMTERFSKDAILWMWKQDGRVVGSVWSIRETPPERFFFPLSPEDAYLFDGEISADVRGQGIFMSLLHAVAEGIWLEGCRRIYFCVSDWNRSSLRAVGKTWYRRFGKARHIPLGRYDVVIWAEMAHRRAEEMP